MKCAKAGCNKQASSGNYCLEHKPDYGGTETRLQDWNSLIIRNKTERNDKTDKKKDK